ncbi:MAG: ATP-binding protein [bacterium]|nr:ATP-binding protein [bacterium]
MQKFEIFNKFNNAVLVINNNLEITYTNKVFDRTFGKFSSFENFCHLLSFDTCVLESGNIEMYSPIYQAAKSPHNFFSCATFQTSEKKLYFNITSIKKKNYTIITLDDTTAQHELNLLQKEYEKISNKVEELSNNNQNLIKVQQEAQTQALKMALINKISTSMRESIALSKIISSTIQQLSNMFGATKIYYASTFENSFKIEQINKEYKFEQGQIIEFDAQTQEKILKKEIVISHCIKEHSKAISLKKAICRIIVPIYYGTEHKGIIVILISKPRELSDEVNVLENVSTQLANAINQAELYEKDLKTVNELKKTLKELKETQIQLINSEKMASLGQLIAGVAHEINTPLASINANNGMIAKLIKQINDADLQEMISSINQIDKEAVSRISNIVKSLKKFVRLDEAELQEADINKEIDLTLDIIRHETKNKAEIIKNYGDIPMIKCYPNMLNQVFMNILVNACQSIETKGTITISTSFQNNSLSVSIKDSGKGIKKELIDKIFQPGYTTKQIGIGTGLGLAISEKIIEKHNGKITVNSEENIGTEFIITIPS